MYRLATTFTLGLAAGAAHAAGPTSVPADTVVAPPPSPVYARPANDWSGAYGGVQLGYGTGEFSTDTDDYDSDGVIGGFHLGYNWNMGDWVVGTELQYDKSELEIDSGTGSGSFDEIARLKLRAGREFGAGLLYGTAGLAYANFNGASGALSGDLNDPGYTLGLGYDYRLNERWTLGGEYQHHMFDDFGATGNDVDFGTAHVRVSYGF